MRNTVLILVFVLSAKGILLAQHKPLPGTEAWKAISYNDRQEMKKDSLAKVFKGRFTLAPVFGQHFVTRDNKSNIPDTITFTSFSSRRAFYGLEVGYFIDDLWQLSITPSITFLPRRQDITSINFGGSNGISAEGVGSGGVAIRFESSIRRFFPVTTAFRPYLSAQLGLVNLFSKGGSGSFTLSGGQQQDINSQSARMGSVGLKLGFQNRFNPGFGIDFSVGYSATSKSKPIGGVDGFGGVTTSVALQFFLNPDK